MHVLGALEIIVWKDFETLVTEGLKKHAKQIFAKKKRCIVDSAFKVLWAFSGLFYKILYRTSSLMQTHSHLNNTEDNTSKLDVQEEQA